MKITIGQFDAETRTVSAKFVHAGVTHTRQVNACLDSKGKYDQVATKARVEEVALGVEKKIDLGVIANAPPATPEEAPAA